MVNVPVFLLIPSDGSTFTVAGLVDVLVQPNSFQAKELAFFFPPEASPLHIKSPCLHFWTEEVLLTQSSVERCRCPFSLHLSLYNTTL